MLAGNIEANNPDSPERCFSTVGNRDIRMTYALVKGEGINRYWLMPERIG